MAAPMFTLKGKGSLLGGDVAHSGTLPQEPLAGCTATLTFNAKGFLGVNEQMSSVEPVEVEFDDAGWLNGPNGVGLLAADPSLHLSQRPTWKLVVKGEFDGYERTFHSFEFAAGVPGEVIPLDAVAHVTSARQGSTLVGKQGPRSRLVKVSETDPKYQWQDEFGNFFGDRVNFDVPELRPFNLQNSVYNYKAANSRRLRAGLGRAASGKGAAHFLMIGDSLTAGVMGGAETPTANKLTAWPEVFRQTLANGGIPTGGTGVCPVITGDYNYDPRWIIGPNWDLTLGFVAFTSVSSSVVGFKSDQPGRYVTVYYMNNSTALQLVVDGNIAVGALPVTGANTVASYTYDTGANLAHEVAITTIAATYNAVIGINIHNAVGLQCHNIGVGGARAHSSVDFLNCWEFTNDNYVYFTLAGAVAKTVATPDCVFIGLGGNDQNDPGYNRTNTINAIKAVRNRFPNSDCVLIGEMELSGKDQPTFLVGLYALAAELDIPLFDLYDRLGPYATAVANGMMGGDGAHPNARAHADMGRAMARLVMS